MYTRIALIVLGIAAVVPVLAAPPQTATRQSPWVQTAPGVYQKTQSDGAHWEMHVGASGARVDRDRIAREIWTLQTRLSATKDASRKAAIRRQIVELQPLLAAAQAASGTPAAKTGATSVELANANTSASLLTDYQYTYHDQVTSKLCGLSVTQNADMGNTAYPGFDAGGAQTSVSWVPDKLQPTSYTLGIRGYARAGNSYGTMQTALGPLSISAKTTGSASSPVAVTSDADFGCRLETYSQVTGPAACPAFVSFTRAKYCYELVH